MSIFDSKLNNQTPLYNIQYNKYIPKNLISQASRGEF